MDRIIAVVGLAFVESLLGKLQWVEASQERGERVENGLNEGQLVLYTNEEG